jgi:hypothetical protein
MELYITRGPIASRLPGIVAQCCRRASWCLQRSQLMPRGKSFDALAAIALTTSARIVREYAPTQIWVAPSKVWKPNSYCEWSRTRRGRTAGDQSTFPSDFLDQFRRVVRRRTIHLGQHPRARLVLLLHEPPTISNIAAGAYVELHPNSVRLWRRRWACGDFSLADQAGRGRKPAFSPLATGRSLRRSRVRLSARPSCR